MNILLMISKNDKYGAQRIFLDQVRVLHQMGHTVVVVGRGNEGYVPDSVRALDVDYHGIPMKGLKDIFLLRQLIKKYNIHVIHTTLDRADYFGVLLSWVTGKPVVSTMMVPRYHIGFRFADRVVVLSNQQRDLLKAKGIKPAKISVIRPGIDVERFSNPDKSKREFWRKKLGTDNYSIIFCHIASMIPRKAHAVSIELVAECKKRGEEPLLIIIGDPLHGEYYESLVQKIRDLGLERNVVFTGWTSEVPEILSLSHFTVLPSENEALGIVLMEGMAAGTPVIAREREGGAELIDEYRAGFFYEPDVGVLDLAEKIITLNRNSAAYRELSSKFKIIAIDRFSLQHFGGELVNLYQNLL
jgi:glycosyltransferase involved in cell wall biosynthesis